jgi:hypothetical protein
MDSGHKMSLFRHWVHNLWIENCEERLQYHSGTPLDKQEYFNHYKWWLRREYRYQQRIEREKYEFRKKQQ